MNRRIVRSIALFMALLAGTALGCGLRPLQSVPDASPTPETVALFPSAQQAASAPSAAPSGQAGFPRGDYVLFVNVGKADAALIHTGGEYYLVDTGTEESAPALIGALRAAGVTVLSGMFLTHTHSDHIGGASAVARAFQVEQVYAAEISEDKKKGGNKITDLAQELGLPLTRLSAGDAAGPFTVLGPLVKDAADDNDNSLVLRLEREGVTALFTGDMQFREEKTLLDAHTDLKCDLLKVGNHGNPDATSPEFAAAAAPSVAVVSTDTGEDEDSDNIRVHAALEEAGAVMYSTQGTALGLLVELNSGLAVHAPTRPQTALSLTLSPPDTDAQAVSLHNGGNGAALLGGCMLLSERGGELYVFPEGVSLASGQALVLAAEGGNGDLIWLGETKPWNKNKADAALLYDFYGNLLSRTP